MQNSLVEFLEAKPLYYETIDYTRMPKIYKSIQEKLPLPKIIHLIGTNGKGTTGRFLATALHKASLSVGHYTSPHILAFNERIWINGVNIDEDTLQAAHVKLSKLLTKKDANALSYFEYTTLLAMVAFEGLEYVVLEAGLGGEHDATSVFSNILTLVTPIDIDHEAFLGSSIQEIATTKLNAIQKSAIVAKQSFSEVQELLHTLQESKDITWCSYEDYLREDDKTNIQEIAKSSHLPLYLEENLSLAIAALKELRIDYTVAMFKDAKLFGRLTQITPNIIIDVGHNTLAAKAIYESLKGKKYTLVYNSYKDKEYTQILKILSPIIESVSLIVLEDTRIESHELLTQTLQNLNLDYEDFTQIEEDKNYLVFGSFLVVEAFLKELNG